MLNSLFIKGKSPKGIKYSVEYTIDVVQNLSGSKFNILGIKGLTDEAISVGCINKVGTYDILDFTSIIDKTSVVGRAGLFLLDEVGVPKLIAGVGTTLTPTENIFSPSSNLNHNDLLETERKDTLS